MRAANVFVVVALIGWGFSGAAQGDEPASQSVDPASVRAAAYTFFMRPPGVDKDYDTWADAAGPDIGEVELDAGRLPSRVDNSARPEFPPVYRQKFGACGQFTAVASMFTYEMNVLNGTKADADERRFPATFSWNMMNRAENRGSEAYHGWEVAKQVGIPTLKRYGKVEDPTLGKWPSGYDVCQEGAFFHAGLQPKGGVGGSVAPKCTDGTWALQDDIGRFSGSLTLLEESCG